MSRRRPNHPRITGDDVASDESAPRRLRSRRRRRRALRGAIKTVFWALVLAGVFILGIGYGANVGGGSNEPGSGDVTITHDPIEVQATLPTVTETVTKTVTERSGKSGNRSSSKKQSN